jgi:hypothetical protein
MSTRLIAAAAIGALFSLTSAVAAVQAAPEGFCRDYAHDAVRQNDIARSSRHCEEFIIRDERRWQSDFRRHFDWCLHVDKAEADRERDIRRHQLEECKRHGGY